MGIGRWLDASVCADHLLLDAPVCASACNPLITDWQASAIISD